MISKMMLQNVSIDTLWIPLALFSYLVLDHNSYGLMLFLLQFALLISYPQLFFLAFFLMFIFILSLRCMIILVCLDVFALFLFNLMSGLKPSLSSTIRVLLGIVSSIKDMVGTIPLCVVFMFLMM